jgi:hypothetical protein
MAVMLLRYNFVYADFIRSFGGRYTYQKRNFDSIWSLVESVQHTKPPKGYPTIDFDRAFRALTEGVPLAGDYVCGFCTVSRRNTYDNHSTILLDEAISLIRKKFRKEEGLSYNVILPRWIWRFLDGIFLNPLTFVLPKHIHDDGRICVDCTYRQDAQDDGAPNAQTRKPAPPSTTNSFHLDNNPPIFYGTALQRFLEYIWNLRIDHPNEDLLVFADDISAAFHRIFYHPSMMVVFASVFEDFLAVPAGTIFGGASSPSYYMTAGELRAWLSNSLPMVGARTPLTDRLQLPTPPTDHVIARIPRATACELHPGAAALRGPACGSLHSSFVDDTGSADTRARIIESITQSVLSAYIVFGFPAELQDGRPPCLNEKKWTELISWTLRFLGYDIDTRAMTVSWPLEKRIRLAAMIDEILELPTGSRSVACILIARILGLVRNGGFVSPLGEYLSLRVQFGLNDAVRDGAGKSTLPWKTRYKRFWQTARLDITADMLADLRFLRSILATHEPHSPFWSRSIGLLIRRHAMYLMWSDASYGGLGGWSRHFGLMWRLSKEDLQAMKFPMVALLEPTDIDPVDALHINVLEFVAVIINTWFALAMSHKNDPDRKQHHIVKIWADNTSALSWMAHAARTKRPLVRRLARFLQALLTFAPVDFQFQQDHIAGKLNDTADALSRFSRAKSWASVIALCPSDLTNLQPYRVPRKLLSAIQRTLDSDSIEELSDKKMTALSMLELKTLPTGWLESDTMTSVVSSSRRGKAGRS